MATVKNIDVALRADVTKFESGLKRGSTSVRDFVGTGLGSLTSKLGGLLNPLTIATAAVAGFGAAIRNALNETSRVSDDAFEFGMDPNVLLGIEHAFDTVGVAQEEVHASLRRLTVAGGDAERGNKKLQATFQQLGINLKTFSSQSGDQRLRAVAAGLAAIESPAKRASIASELFGRKGLSMLEVLGLGTKGLDEAAERVRRFGNVISNEGVAAVTEWEKSIATLKLAWAGFSQTALRAGAPLVNGLAGAMTFASEAFAKFREIAMAGKAAWDPIATSAERAIPKVKELNKEVLRGIQLTEAASHAETLKFEEKFAGFMSKAKADAKSLVESLNVSTPLDDFHAKLARIHELHGMDLITLAQRNKLLEGANRDFMEPQLKAQMETRRGLMEQADELRERFATPIERFQKSLTGLARLKNLGAIDPRTFAQGIQEAAMEFREQAMQFASAEPISGPASIERGTQEAFRSFQQAKSGVEQAKEQVAVLKKVESHLAKMVRNATTLARAPL